MKIIVLRAWFQCYSKLSRNKKVPSCMYFIFFKDDDKLVQTHQNFTKTFDTLLQNFLREILVQVNLG